MSRLKNLKDMFSLKSRCGSLLVAASAVAGLVGCAPIPAGPAEYSAGRTRVVLPNTAWEDPGASNEALPLAPGPGAFPLQTRAMALRGGNKELMAVLLVQTNRTDQPRNPTLWTGACPQQQGLLVEDATSASPVRIDCLRFKRWANNAGWIEKNHPEVARWMAQRNAEPAQPYSHLNYRFATEGGSYVEINAMVDQRLLRPKTSNNEEFLRAGQPAQEWSKKVADAARLSTGMADGFFAVPPFPLPLPQ